MRRSLLLCAILVVPAAVRAQDRDVPTCPDSVTTQFDMRVCADQQYRQRRALLERLLGDLQSALAPDATEDDRRPQLDSAQVAWTAYATAHCAFVASEYSGGTLEPTVNLDCLSEVTVNRIRELAGWLCTSDTEEESCPAADEYYDAVEDDD